MIWKAIGYVSSGIGLVAFLAAVGAWTYSISARERRKLIETADGPDRSQIVKGQLGIIGINPENLSVSQQYKLAITQLRERSRRFSVIAVIFCFVMVITFLLALYAIKQFPAEASTTKNRSEGLAINGVGYSFPDYKQHPYDIDMNHLHPSIRSRISNLISIARRHGIPVFIWETYRTPVKQRKLYERGRIPTWTLDQEGRQIPVEEPISTYADAWDSPKQFGFSASIAKFQNGKWLDFSSAELDLLNNVASEQGLRMITPDNCPLFCTVDMPGVSIQKLREGRYPPGGDREWRQNLRGNIASWAGHLATLVPPQ